MIKLVEVKPPYTLYRVGSDVFNRLTPARVHARITGKVVEQWLPPDKRWNQGVCWEPVRYANRVERLER